MGGWRCSFRNCTMRSDGRTHMFHYPVFDKVRCHQWLVNAGRLDFLNLKVSQLKNRVICQYHFAQENFMNFKRDKLTFDAVPTLNGPFCDVSEGLNKSLEETTNSLSIMFDDIENDEYMTLKDKRANYSVKYADFLTSNELADIDISSCVSQHNVYNKNNYCEIEIPAYKNNDSKSYYTPETKPKQVNTYSLNHKKSSTSEINKKYQTQPVQVVPPYKTRFNQNQLEENILEIQLPPGFIKDNALLKEDSKGNNSIQMSDACADGTVPAIITPKLMNKKTKVKILSEKRISEPLTVTGHLEPLSPSTVLPILKKKPRIPQKVANEVILNNQEANKSFKKNFVKESKLYRDIKAKSPRTSLLKNKITPERVAAIEEKRKFNMKLRDIIESFLDNLDEQDKEIKDSSNVPNQDNKLEETYLSNQSKSLNMAEKTIASLEARIKKMEDALLSKIDQNSQMISELKNTIVQKDQIQKKCCATQTTMDSQCQKKRLYQEISQYLSPSANSLIYEELFINKFMKNIPKASSPKRKRRR